MEKRILGKSDLKVAPLGLGTNVFGWTIDEKKSFEILDAFVAGGFNLVDTADIYSAWIPGNKGGESETIIGNWLKARGKRESVVICTKVGMVAGEAKANVGKKYILEAVEASLRRLQTDYIDLYQTHKDNLQTPVTETLEAYDQLVKEGKVRWIGASNFSVDRLADSLEAAETHGFPAYQCLQPEYNLYDRQPFENELEAFCLEHQIGVINYFSLAAGFLTGKYRSGSDLGQSARGNGVKKYLNDRGFAILDALDKIAVSHQVKPVTVALAWQMARPAITAPLASATSIDQLQALTGAAELLLTREDVELLNKASATPSPVVA